MTEVAIGCPVRSRAWILPQYLSHLEAITHPAKRYLFLENDSEDDTAAILASWQPDAPATIRNLKTPNPPGHQRGPYCSNQYAHLASIRNQFLELFLETDAAYLLSVDSDVLVPPDILQHLLPLADQRTVVGAALCNIAGGTLDGRTPGNFLVEQAGLLLHPPTYPLGGTMEVAVTGACCLIPRSILEAGIRYAPHSQGEDVPLMLAARAAGYRILVSFDVRPQHRMVEEL